MSGTALTRLGYCPYAVEVTRDTYVGCRLPAGHKGPCEPRRAPFQVRTETTRG